MDVEVTQYHIDQGERGDCYTCALALALREKFPGQKVIVSPWHATIDGKDYDLGATGCNFVEDFDNYRPVKPCTITLIEEV